MEKFFGLFFNEHGELTFDQERHDREFYKEQERQTALYDALGTIARARSSLADGIRWVEREFQIHVKPELEWVYAGDVDKLKYVHDTLREAEELLCKGLELKRERLLAGTKYDTPRMLPDDHYYNTKEDIPL